MILNKTRACVASGTADVKINRALVASGTADVKINRACVASNAPRRESQWLA